jgi:hypothetical protein
MNWKTSAAGLPNISLCNSREVRPWTAIRKQWDYLALAFLLGLYVTAATAAVSLRSDAGSNVFDPGGGCWLTTSKSG